MNNPIADFAVIGSNSLARLVAGLLAGTHKRRVLFIGASQASYRLERSMDLSAAPITRPETWSLLSEGTAETLRLLARIVGRGAFRRIDPILTASTPRAEEALSHIRHMAMEFGIATEPTAPARLPSNHVGVAFRDAVCLQSSWIEPGLDAWNDKVGVERIAAESVFVDEDGSVRVIVRGEERMARQAVLADDQSIIAHLPPGQWPALLQRRPAVALMTAPLRPLPTPVLLDIGLGLYVHQQTEGGIALHGPGDFSKARRQLEAILGGTLASRVGQSMFQQLATSDGAPTFGRVAKAGADVIANTGSIGAFLAPALARWLAGEAKTHEAEWFGRRLITRDVSTNLVSEFASAPGISAS
ncbi:hypothetical protein [Devosia chinhatensis]|nr:hypothetical protein [Devosia chinhatensis]